MRVAIVSNAVGKSLAKELLNAPALRWLLLGLLVLVFCAGAEAQDPFPPDHTPDEQLGLTQDRRPLPPQNAIPGEQVVTANELRAPARAQAATQKALTAFKNHRQNEAERHISRALEIYPDYAVALTLRALMKVNTQPSDAVADLEHAIRADPSYGPANALLASMYNDRRQFDNAAPLVQQALRVLPSRWQVHFEMARTLFGRHRSTEALAQVTDAVRLIRAGAIASPEARSSVHFLRGEILVDQRDFEAAKQEFELTLKEEPQGIYARDSNQILARLQSLENR